MNEPVFWPRSGTTGSLGGAFWWAAWSSILLVGSDWACDCLLVSCCKNSYCAVYKSTLLVGILIDTNSSYIFDIEFYDKSFFLFMNFLVTLFFTILSKFSLKWGFFDFKGELEPSLETDCRLRYFFSIWLLCRFYKDPVCWVILNSFLDRVSMLLTRSVMSIPNLLVYLFLLLRGDFY